MSAAAICDFPPFFTQTNSTDGRGVPDTTHLHVSRLIYGRS